MRGLAAHTSRPGQVKIPCRCRTALLSQCTAARPDIAMLEGAILAIILYVELTLRCSLPAHRLLLADRTTLYSSAGSTAAKYMNNIFMILAKQPEFSSARRALRCYRCCQESARGSCSVPPWSMAMLGRAEPDPLAQSRALGLCGVHGGRWFMALMNNALI